MKPKYLKKATAMRDKCAEGKVMEQEFEDYCLTVLLIGRNNVGGICLWNLVK